MQKCEVEEVEDLFTRGEVTRGDFRKVSENETTA
jgi:hypothetical protein